MKITTIQGSWEKNKQSQGREMDLYNNGKGIEIGNKNPDASDNELAKMCQNALYSGELKVVTP